MSNTTHLVPKCYNGFNHSFRSKVFPRGLIATKIAHSQDNSSFVDSGATTHTTADADKLTIPKPIVGLITLSWQIEKDFPFLMLEIL